jgi:hypothetical protein
MLRPGRPPRTGPEFFWEVLVFAAFLMTHLVRTDLNGGGHFVKWGVVQISVANLVVILVMVVLFVAALLLPFPKGKDKS